MTAVAVLVTGADEPWGASAARAVLEAGAVTGVDGHPARVERVVLPVHRAVRDPGIAADPRVVVAHASIRDAGAMRDLVERHGVTSVIHFATVTGDRDGGDEDVERTVGTNIGGSLNLLEALRMHGGGRFVFCGSLSMFADDEPGPISEASTPRLPASLYGATKAAVELLATAYAARDAVDARVAVLPAHMVWPPERDSREVLHGLLGDVVGVGSLDVHAPDDLVVYFNDAVACGVNLLELHDLPRERVGPRPTVFQPGVTASIGELRVAIEERAVAAGLPVRSAGLVTGVAAAAAPVPMDLSRAAALGLTAPTLAAIADRWIRDRRAIEP